MTIPRNLSFLAQGADSTGVLSVPYGGTGNVTLTAGYIPYGNGTSAFGSSSNLFWSSANNRLGLGTTSPSYTLDVTGTFRNTGIARLGTGATTTIANIGDDGTVGTKIIQFSRASAVSDVVNIQGINAGVGATYIALQALGGGVSIGNTTDPGSGNLSVTGTGKFGTTSVAYASGEQVSILGASSSNGMGIAVVGTGAKGIGIYNGNSTGATNGTMLEFQNASSGVVGSITSNGTATAYNISSDQRLKENIVDAPAGNIDNIKIRSFDWKSDGSHQTYGMVAQELLEVAPYAVSQPQNTDEFMGVDYSKLVPMMIKEIQDLKARIATLEAK